MKKIGIPSRPDTKEQPGFWNRLAGSMLLPFLILRYMGASMVTAAVDYASFLALYPLLDNIPTSIFLARLVALVINFLLLRKAVFFSSRQTHNTFPRYLLLVALSGTATSFLVGFFNRHFNIPVIYGKILAEALLYLINFNLLKGLVFLPRQKGYLPGAARQEDPR